MWFCFGFPLIVYIDVSLHFCLWCEVALAYQRLNDLAGPVWTCVWSLWHFALCRGGVQEEVKWLA